jgi:hypothetical protein
VILACLVHIGLLLVFILREAFALTVVKVRVGLQTVPTYYSGESSRARQGRMAVAASSAGSFKMRASLADAPVLVIAASNKVR